MLNSAVDFYQKGVLYLSHSVALADGVNLDVERVAIDRIREEENIPEQLFAQFSQDISNSSDKDIFQTGIESLKQCPKDDQIRTFAWIWKIINADGHVHVKEARFLMYALRSFDLDIDEVISFTDQLPQVTEA